MKRIRRPHWRKMTWALIIWSALMALWIIAALGQADPAGSCVHHAYLSKQSCEEASSAGTGIGVGILIFLWFLVFVPLSLVWLMTRPKTQVAQAEEASSSTSSA